MASRQVITGTACFHLNVNLESLGPGTGRLAADWYWCSLCARGVWYGLKRLLLALLARSDRHVLSCSHGLTPTRSAPYGITDRPITACPTAAFARCL
jgi:hypothetical protein